MNHPKVIFTIVCCIFINIRSCIRARGKADRADGQREQLKINKEREREQKEKDGENINKQIMDKGSLRK